jgi:hypothetical protein
MNLKELARIYPFVKRDMRENNKEKRKEVVISLSFSFLY